MAQAIGEDHKILILTYTSPYLQLLQVNDLFPEILGGEPIKSYETNDGTDNDREHCISYKQRQHLNSKGKEVKLYKEQ